MIYVAVAAGGALGAMVRYGLSGWLHDLTGMVFPVGTLAVNIVGSFIIGLVLELSTDRFLIAPEVRALLTTGFCGALTTFSTFSYETITLLQGQQWISALGNVLLNVIVCITTAYLGMLLARAV